MAAVGFFWKFSCLVGAQLLPGLVFEVIGFEENHLLFGCWARSMSGLGVVVNVIVVACRRGLGQS